MNIFHAKNCVFKISKTSRMYKDMKISSYADSRYNGSFIDIYSCIQIETALDII